MTKKIIDVEKTCHYCHYPILYTKKTGKEIQKINTGTIDVKRKRYMCWSCYSLHYHLRTTDSYFTNGKTLGIENVSRIKLRICRDGLSKSKDMFFFNVYVDTICDEKQKRTYFGRSSKEFSFRINLNEYCMNIDLLKEKLKEIMTRNLNRVRIPERKMLVTNKNFVDFTYECIQKSINNFNKVLIYEYGI